MLLKIIMAADIIILVLIAYYSGKIEGIRMALDELEKKDEDE